MWAGQEKLEALTSQLELVLKFIVTNYVNYIFFCDSNICTEDETIPFKVRTSKMSLVLVFIIKCT